MRERIISAAVCSDGLIWSAPAPARHGDVLEKMDGAGVSAIEKGIPDNQGFLTSEGRFVQRREAAKIAILAGQIFKPKWPPQLFSEDLW